MDFTIGCTLSYSVSVLTPFVFNLEAAQFPRQRIRSERLTTTPALAEPDRFLQPESSNRVLRYLVPPGQFTIQ